MRPSAKMRGGCPDVMINAPLGDMWQTSCPLTRGSTIPPDGRRAGRRRCRPRREARKARDDTQYEELFTAKARNLVKGAGQVTLGGDRGSTGIPLSDGQHGTEIMTRSHDTIMKTRAATWTARGTPMTCSAGSTRSSGTIPR